LFGAVSRARPAGGRPLRAAAGHDDGAE
jgi:hypothetical protein